MPRHAGTNEPRQPPRQALRAREAAVSLGISERTLWEWTRDHGVPHFRIGNTVLYPTKLLDLWLEKQAAQHMGGGVDPPADASTAPAVTG